MHLWRFNVADNNKRYLATHVKYPILLLNFNQTWIFWADCRIARSKRDGKRAATRFGLSAKRTSPFKSAGVSVQSTTGSRGVRISGQQLYRPCSDVQCKAVGYPLHSHLSPSLPSLRHGVPSGSESAIRVPNIKFHGNPFSWSSAYTCGQTERQRDRHRDGHDKAIAAFSYYTKTPKVPVSAYSLGLHALIKRFFFLQFSINISLFSVKSHSTWVENAQSVEWLGNGLNNRINMFWFPKC